jgi:hypothetical protein
VGLRRQLERLEEVYGSGGWNGPPCEECGWRGPDDTSEPARRLLTFEGDKDYELVPLDEDGEPKEYCLACGRKLIHFVSFTEGHHLYYVMIPKA